MDKQNAVKALVRLVALCESAQSSGAAYEEHNLSPEEEELLILSADTGMFRVEAADDAPAIWISVQPAEGNWLAQNAVDPATAAIAVSGFERLCARGFAQHSEGSLFVLNGEGFKRARAYRIERQRRENQDAAKVERKRAEEKARDERELRLKERDRFALILLMVILGVVSAIGIIGVLSGK